MTNNPLPDRIFMSPEDAALFGQKYGHPGVELVCVGDPYVEYIRSPAAVKVKPLLWQLYPEHGPSNYITGGFGFIYEAGVNMDGQAYWGAFLEQSKHEQVTGGLENAKAAAQAHYEAQILSALDVAPAMTMAEAARILADARAQRKWPCFLVEMLLNAEGAGPAKIGEDAKSLTYEVWENGSFNTISSHKYLPDAVEAALRAIAAYEDPSHD